MPVMGPTPPDCNQYSNSSCIASPYKWFYSYGGHPYSCMLLFTSNMTLTRMASTHLLNHLSTNMLFKLLMFLVMLLFRIPLRVIHLTAFDRLLVQESPDDNEDGSFKSNPGSESDDNSGDQSTPDWKLIFNDEVGIWLFSHNLDYLPNAEREINVSGSSSWNECKNLL